nr:lamin tail domain-containing protein [uncultured Pedobacter sp.]
MGKFLLFFSLFIANVAFCQVNDDFNDGDFTQNPVWQPDVATNFVVNNGQLQSNSTTLSSNFYISTANSKALSCGWEFDVNLKFATSGTNYVDIYLVSNTADLKSASINGYFVRMGDTPDEVSLYKRSGALSSSVKLIDGRDGSVASSSNNNFKFRVTRESNGAFSLERDSTGTGNSFYKEGSVADNSFTTTVAFGFYIQQSTASFIQKHFFDNVVVKDIVLDTTPPVFVKASSADGKAIVLNFDEPVDVSDASLMSHYTITPGNIQPTNVRVNGSIVTLDLASQLNTGNYTVQVNSIKDLKGNVATSQNKDFTYKKPYTAVFNDVVINEIFADPSPQVDLPSVEFVELWNRTAEDIALSGFKYSDGTTTYTFTGDSIKANQYIVLCAKTDTLEFKKYGKVLGLSPWPSLNNPSDNLKLVNQNGITISEVSYSDSWYKDDVKKTGGWSLELIDPLSVCRPSQNYSASKDITGGTPGEQNSIYLSNKTTEPLKLLSVSLKDSVTLSLMFNQGLDSLQATLPSHYTVNNGVGSPASVMPIGPAFLNVELKYSQKLNRNQTYNVTVDGLADCGSNLLTSQTLSFVYPGLIVKGDILINEVLFNPKAGGVDFVEVYNASHKILDLKDLKIATIASTKDSVISIKAVSVNTILFQPKSYWVITSNPDSVKSQYYTSNPNNFIKLSSFPVYADDKGKVVILKDTARLDQLNYDKSMHFALLRDVEGISLERSSFTESTNATGNFRSATAVAGYATPGDKNSQYLENLANAVEEISLPVQTFSPDNDGFEDILRIQYKFIAPGKIANVTIYNDQGRLMKKLVSNETLNAEGQWIWDGMDEHNSKAKTGIYIIYFEIYDLNGNVKKYKKPVALASKLD